MTALKCDRCNGYFDYDPNTENFIAFGHKHIDTGRTFPVKDIDICPNCMELFHKWFENPDSWKPEDCLMNVGDDDERLNDLCEEAQYQTMMATAKREDILGKTVEEAMPYIVSFYKNCSGNIKVYDNEDSENVLTLDFLEGNGYLVTDNLLMGKIIYKFTISGIGYYKLIELYATDLFVKEEYICGR